MTQRQLLKTMSEMFNPVLDTRIKVCFFLHLCVMLVLPKFDSETMRLLFNTNRPYNCKTEDIQEDIQDPIWFSISLLVHNLRRFYRTDRIFPTGEVANFLVLAIS